MKEKHEEKSIPKPVVKLEDLYDIKDRFKHVTNSKLQSSTLRFELINLGTEQNPQNTNLGLRLSEQERTTFIRLLRKNKHVFAWNYDDLKTYDTSIIQHTIPMLPEQKPVQQKLRKIHPNLESQIKSELNKLLKAKIIFPVRHSNWVSNMVPVRKKNGDIRICIDFRNLNKASQKYNFPLPTMEQILHSLAGSELMSFLDGFSGYNQVLVHPDDRLKTTFRTKWGTYAYQKMPFGLINAGATFQREMDIAFKGLINKTVVVYLDDITVFSKKRSNHLHDLNQIFEHCRRYGISLNPKKSFFSLDQGKLIGFIFSKDGIYIDPDRIKEISEIPFPHNKKSMQQFLVRQLLIQRELGEKRANWVTTLQEYDLEIKPAKIVRGQGFCRLLAGASNILESGDTDHIEEIKQISITDYESQYADLIFYLKNGHAPPNLSYKNKRDIILKSKNFFIIDDVRFRQNYDSVLLICLEKPEAQKVLQELHDGPAGGHFGADTTTHKIIHAGYYWPTLFRDTHEYVRKCRSCQVSSGRQRKPAFPLQPVNIDQHFEQWGLDIIGEITPQSSKQHKYILIATDYFTKWVEAIPLKTTKSEGIIEFIDQFIITTFCVPNALVFYNSSYFSGNSMFEFAIKRGFKLKYSANYYPQGNGLAESTNKNLLKIIK
eukprot:PITA_04642